MTEAECIRVTEGNRWRERQARKKAYEIEKVLIAIKAKEEPCPLCEKKRLERIHREEEEKRNWYDSLTRGQQIMAKIRGDYP